MKIVYTLLFVLIAGTLYSQPKTKTKAPTQKQLESSTKEMQAMLEEAMKDMSDEDRRMMDSMGIKMPNLKEIKIPKATDKQLATAWEDENRIVPKKDASRIAAIPTITAAGMKTYLASIQKKSAAKLSPAIISFGDKVVEYARSQGNSAAQIGSIAAGFWTAGKAEIALYLLSRACVEAPDDTDNLSNYAAVLSMMGGQHLAIPLLNNLNSKYKKNSTLLNNLGQAWFGLGEMSKAEKYLDSALALYPFHPQANLTKSRIEESKGNTAKAVEAVKKSIQHAYSKEKEDRLKKLGYQVKLSDLRFSFKRDGDPLGLNRYRRPDYPKTLGEAKNLNPLWEAFNAEIKTQLAKLQKELDNQTALYTKDINSMATQAMQAINSGSGAPSFMKPPLFAKKASLVVQQLEQHQAVVQQKLVEKFQVLRADLDKIEKERRRVDPSAHCSQHRDAFNEYLGKHNMRKKIYDDEVLQIRGQFYSEIVYWSQYTSTNKIMYETIRLNFQISWLKILNEQSYQPLLPFNYYEDCVEEDKNSKGGKLAEFDNTDACKYKSKISFLGVGSLTTNCSHSTYEFSLKDIPMGPFKELEYRYTEAGVKYENSTIKFATRSLGIEAESGPLKAELGVSAKGTIEMDPTGVTDWKGVVSPGAEIGVGISNGTVKAGASVGASVDVEMAPSGVTDVNIVTKGGAGLGLDAEGVPAPLEMGIESRVSIITGQSSTSGTGLLSDIKF